MLDGEVISVPSDDEDEAPAPKHGTLTSFWQLPNEPSTPPRHRRLSDMFASRGGASSSIAFYESLEQVRTQRIEEAECTAKRKHERALRKSTGKLTPPEEQRRGVNRGFRVGGRPNGSNWGY